MPSFSESVSNVLSIYYGVRLTGMVKQEPYKQYAAQATRPQGMKPWEKVKFTNFTLV
jgi:hypothetical protein